MYLRYHAGRTIRHGASAVLEAALVVAIAGALVFGFAVAAGVDPGGAGAALAGKGKPGLATVSSSIQLDAGSDLRLGGTVTFSTTAVDLNGGEYPLLYVACYAEANGNIVYGQLDHPNVTFVLGGGSSDWWTVGGSADCKAWLYAYGGKSRGYDTIRELAGPIQFSAGG